MHLVTPPPPLDSKSIEENIITFYLFAFMYMATTLWPKHMTLGPPNLQ